MTKEEIQLKVKNQRDFFSTGITLSVEKRIEMLKKLRRYIIDNEKKIEEKIKKDLGKSPFESYMCEVGIAVSELNYILLHIKSFSKERTVITPIIQTFSHSYVKPVPYGVTLIMSPWNYPFMLTLCPLIDALAAGNTCVVKPSAYSPHTSAVIKEMIDEIFPEEYVCVITGGREENGFLLDEKFDYIFFTGSKEVGRLVLEKAAVHLTAVTLELGGKSPCIIDDTAHLKLAARRLVFGKGLNVGQTCVAPDYVLVQKSVKDKFIECVKKEIKRQFGENPLINPNYGKIINEKHFDRILSLIDENKVVYGGKSDRKSLKIELTVMDNVTTDDDIMKQEIFGPVIPVLTFESIDDVISLVNAGDKPLALYIFSNNSKSIKKATSQIQYGGGCINDTVIHIVTTYMGFGGVGESGMGSYHGKTGFDTFSHHKSIVKKYQWLDLRPRYQPYNKFNEFLTRFFTH